MDILFLIDNTVCGINQNLHRLLHYLHTRGTPYLRIRTLEDLLNAEKEYTPNACILSGSSLMFTKRDIDRYQDKFILNLEILKKYHKKIPIMGICFGAQLITLYCSGGKLERLSKQMCKSIPVLTSTGVVKFYVCLHYVMRKVPRNFFVRVHTPEIGPTLVEDLVHLCMLVFFHPEHNTQTWKYLDQFLALC